MASILPLSRDEAAAAARQVAAEPRGARRVHPLKAWRLMQTVSGGPNQAPRPMGLADAARAYSAFIGRVVPYHTWRSWELYRDEQNSRIPLYEDARGLFLFTRGQVRPDHYYGLDELRRLMAEAGDEALSAELLRHAAPGPGEAGGS